MASDAYDRNRVLVKKFFEFKKFWEEVSGKTIFHLENPGGRKYIVSFHPQHIHIFFTSFKYSSLTLLNIKYITIVRVQFVSKVVQFR